MKSRQQCGITSPSPLDRDGRRIHPFTGSVLGIHPFTGKVVGIHPFTGKVLGIHHFTGKVVGIHPFTGKVLGIHHFTGKVVGIHPFTRKVLGIHHFTGKVVGIHLLVCNSGRNHLYFFHNLISTENLRWPLALMMTCASLFMIMLNYSGLLHL